MTRWTADDVPALDGEVVVVTGANSGLGFEGTKLFAEAGATVVMACRSTRRGETAADEIRAATPGVDLDVRECDLADLDSVAAFAGGLRADYDTVDVLCNNAGVMAIPRRETTDGFEMQLGVNHFGHFALTGRLLPRLVTGDGEARVVTQSSGAHEQGEVDFSDLDSEESYSKWAAYSQSKLANLLFAYELDRRLGEHDLPVVSVACHPGWAATNLQLRTGEESGFPLGKLGMRLLNKLFAQSADRGALPMVYAATADDLDGGEYVGPDGFRQMRGYPEVQESSPASYDEADARRLWELSTERTGVTYPFADLAPAAD
ncbi:MAG: oxidoreductase [Halobaculum sp.]